MITGHGYQVKDLNGDEKDGLDECIYYNKKLILDDDIYS